MTEEYILEKMEKRSSLSSVSSGPSGPSGLSGLSGSSGSSKDMLKKKSKSSKQSKESFSAASRKKLEKETEQKDKVTQVRKNKELDDDDDDDSKREITDKKTTTVSGALTKNQNNSSNESSNYNNSNNKRKSNMFKSESNCIYDNTNSSINSIHSDEKTQTDGPRKTKKNSSESDKANRADKSETENKKQNAEMLPMVKNMSQTNTSTSFTSLNYYSNKLSRQNTDSSSEEIQKSSKGFPMSTIKEKKTTTKKNIYSETTHPMYLSSSNSITITEVESSDTFNELKKRENGKKKKKKKERSMEEKEEKEEKGKVNTEKEKKKNSKNSYDNKLQYSMDNSSKSNMENEKREEIDTDETDDTDTGRDTGRDTGIDTERDTGTDMEDDKHTNIITTINNEKEKKEKRKTKRKGKNSVIIQNRKKEETTKDTWTTKTKTKTTTTTFTKKKNEVEMEVKTKKNGEEIEGMEKEKEKEKEREEEKERIKEGEEKPQQLQNEVEKQERNMEKRVQENEIGKQKQKQNEKEKEKNTNTSTNTNTNTNTNADIEITKMESEKKDGFKNLQKSKPSLQNKGRKFKDIFISFIKREDPKKLEETNELNNEEGGEMLHKKDKMTLTELNKNNNNTNNNNNINNNTVAENAKERANEKTTSNEMLKRKKSSDMDKQQLVELKDERNKMIETNLLNDKLGLSIKTDSNTKRNMFLSNELATSVKNENDEKGQEISSKERQSFTKFLSNPFITTNTNTNTNIDVNNNNNTSTSTNNTTTNERETPYKDNASEHSSTGKRKPNTMYNNFLESLKHPSCKIVVDKVKKFILTFPQNINRELAANKVHGFITETQPILLNSKIYKNLNKHQINMIIEGYEKFIMQKLFFFLYQMDNTDKDEDEKIYTKINCLQWIELKHLEICDEINVENLKLAQRELLRLQKMKAPKDKLIMILNCCRIVTSVLYETKKRKKQIKRERQQIEGNEQNKPEPNEEGEIEAGESEKEVQENTKVNKEKEEKEKEEGEVEGEVEGEEEGEGEGEEEEEEEEETQTEKHSERREKEKTEKTEKEKWKAENTSKQLDVSVLEKEYMSEDSNKQQENENVSRYMSNVVEDNQTNIPRNKSQLSLQNSLNSINKMHNSFKKTGSFDMNSTEKKKMETDIPSFQINKKREEMTAEHIYTSTENNKEHLNTSLRVSKKYLNENVEMESDDELLPCADEVLPLLIYVIIKTNPHELISNILYIQHFRHPNHFVSEEAYSFTQFCSGVEFIKELGKTTFLNISEEEYKQKVSEAEQKYLKEVKESHKKLQEAAGKLNDLVKISSGTKTNIYTNIINKIESLNLTFEKTEDFNSLTLANLPAFFQEYKKLIQFKNELLEELNINYSDNNRIQFP